MFVSCTDDTDDFNQVENSIANENIQAIGKRSFNEALAIAEEAVNRFYIKTRAASRTVDLDNVKYITSKSRTRTVGSDTLLYVFNYSDESGFAVVSSSRNTEGLIALIEEGTYDPENTNEENTGFNMYMNMAENYVATADFEIIDPELPGIKEYKEV